MKLAALARHLVLPLALLATASLTFAAPASVVGGAAGRYRVVAADTIALEGTVDDANGLPLHHMSAQLVGAADHGRMLGRLVQLPPPSGQSVLLHLEYDMIGSYHRDRAGQLHFDARLFLDIDLGDGHLYVPAGNMSGVLGESHREAVLASAVGGYCPGGFYYDAPHQDDSLSVLEGGAAAPNAIASPSQQSVIRVGSFRARYAMNDA